MTRSGGSRCGPRTIAIDAHAHLRRSFEVPTALDHAAAHFRRALGARRPVGGEEALLGALLLAETPECHPFFELAGRKSFGVWELAVTGEGISLLARGPEGAMLLLVAGRQVATRERLEVLALGCRTDLEEGAPVNETLEAVRRAGGLSVLPWGFGKWWGKRGRIVRRLLDEAWPGELFLGDNGNRPRAAPRPALFGEAEARGLSVLPGSDPLPLASHVRRLGSYGLVLPTKLDFATPAERLKSLLRRSSLPGSWTGRREGPIRFVSDQLRIRAR